VESLSFPSAASTLIDLQIASGDVLQTSFPSAGIALANMFLFTSIMFFTSVVKSLKSQAPPIPKDQQGFYDRELISPR
jgi:hypothetical protein